MRLRVTGYLLIIMAIGVYSCNNHADKKSAYVFYKGVYSFGPGEKLFKDCYTGREFWAIDSSEQLELKYTQLNFEKPFEPVYVEVEGIKVHSGKDGLASEYDSTLVVKKLVKISKEIPQDMCN